MCTHSTQAEAITTNALSAVHKIMCPLSALGQQQIFAEPLPRGKGRLRGTSIS